MARANAHACKLSALLHIEQTPQRAHRKKTHGVMSASCGSRGLRRITPWSGGLKPRAVAGGPSVTRLTQRSCTGMRPSGMPRAAVKKMLNTSPMLLEIMYLRTAATLTCSHVDCTSKRMLQSWTVHN